MIHKVLVVGPLHCNCSILADGTSREAIVVDPGADISSIMKELDGLTVKFIVVTHAHIDHIAGAQQLKRLTGAPILYNEKDLPLVAMMDIQAGWLGIPTPEVAPPDDLLTHGKLIHINNLSATVLHTPGHTEGSICLYLPQQSLLLSGDTLFHRSIGRTDLPGGDSKAILKSIYSHLLALPDEVHVLPGHGQSTSIGAERRENPFLKSM